MPPSATSPLDDFESVEWNTATQSTSRPSSPAPKSPSPEEHPNPASLFGEPREADEGEGDKWDGWMDVRIVDYKKELENGKESYVSFGVETKVSPTASAELGGRGIEGGGDGHQPGCATTRAARRPMERAQLERVDRGTLSKLAVSDHEQKVEGSRAGRPVAVVRMKLTSDLLPPASLAVSPRQTNLPTFSKPQVKVRRRFQDFVFLHNNLVKDFPACIVPPLPDKHRLGQSPRPQPSSQSGHPKRADHPFGSS